MDLPKQELGETINLNSIPPANTTTGSESAEADTAVEKNPENAEANTAVDKKSGNAINNYSSIDEADEGVAFTVEEAIEFTARLRRGDNDPTKDPIDQAKEDFVNLATRLNAELANLSLEDRARRQDEVFSAEEGYKNKLAEQEAIRKKERLEALQKRFAADEDDSDSFNAIAKGKVLAKLTVRRTECAMVELKEVEGGECYQVFDANLVDQEQLRNAPDYDDLNPKKISPGQAAQAFAVAYRGSPETLLSTFDLEDFLAPKLPKHSSPGVTARAARTTIWIMGCLKEEKGPDGKLIRSGLWMMPRRKWEGMKPSREKKKIYDWGVGRAIRQFRNYHDALEAEKEMREFKPETTPEYFGRAGSPSAADWQVPSQTPEPQGDAGKRSQRATEESKCGNGESNTCAGV